MDQKMRFYSKKDVENKADENVEDAASSPPTDIDTAEHHELQHLYNTKRHQYGLHPNEVRGMNVRIGKDGMPSLEDMLPDKESSETHPHHEKPSLLQLLLHYRYAVFTFVPISESRLAIVQLVPQGVKYRIVLMSVLSCTAFIVVLFVILTAVERLRKRWHLTSGSLERDARAAVYGIIGVATLVFLASPTMKHALYRHASFLAGEVGCLPALTSTFVHLDMFHVLFNMYALYSFGPLMGIVLGPEHFLFAFLSGSILSCISTSILDLLFLRRQVLTVGASGGLYFILGMFSQFFPDHELQLIFLPTFSFSAQNGILALFCFDLGGLILQKFGRGFRLGHAAHLGGLIGGILYARYAAGTVWKQNVGHPNELLDRILAKRQLAR